MGNGRGKHAAAKKPAQKKLTPDSLAGKAEAVLGSKVPVVRLERIAPTYLLRSQRLKEPEDDAANVAQGPSGDEDGKAGSRLPEPAKGGRKGKATSRGVKAGPKGTWKKKKGGSWGKKVSTAEETAPVTNRNVKKKKSKIKTPATIKDDPTQDENTLGESGACLRNVKKKKSKIKTPATIQDDPTQDENTLGESGACLRNVKKKKSKIKTPATIQDDPSQDENTLGESGACLRNVKKKKSKIKTPATIQDENPLGETGACPGATAELSACPSENNKASVDKRSNDSSCIFTIPKKLEHPRCKRVMSRDPEDSSCKTTKEDDSGCTFTIPKKRGRLTKNKISSCDADDSSCKTAKEDDSSCKTAKEDDSSCVSAMPKKCHGSTVKRITSCDADDKTCKTAKEDDSSCKTAKEDDSSCVSTMPKKCHPPSVKRITSCDGDDSSCKTAKEDDSSCVPTMPKKCHPPNVKRITSCDADDKTCKISKEDDSSCVSTMPKKGHGPTVKRITSCDGDDKTCKTTKEDDSSCVSTMPKKCHGPSVKRIISCDVDDSSCKTTKEDDSSCVSTVPKKCHGSTVKRITSCDADDKTCKTTKEDDSSCVSAMPKKGHGPRVKRIISCDGDDSSCKTAKEDDSSCVFTMPKKCHGPSVKRITSCDADDKTCKTTKEDDSSCVSTVPKKGHGSTVKRIISCDGDDSSCKAAKEDGSRASETANESSMNDEKLKEPDRSDLPKERSPLNETRCKTATEKKFPVIINESILRINKVKLKKPKGCARVIDDPDPERTPRRSSKRNGCVELTEIPDVNGLVAFQGPPTRNVDNVKTEVADSGCQGLEDGASLMVNGNVEEAVSNQPQDEDASVSEPRVIVLTQDNLQSFTRGKDKRQTIIEYINGWSPDDETEISLETRDKEKNVVVEAKEEDKDPKSQQILSSPKIPKGPTTLSSPKIPKGPSILSSPKIPKGPTTLSSPKIIKSPTILSSPKIQKGPTTLSSPKIPKGPTILSSPKIPKGPTTLSSPKIPKSPTILSSPKIPKGPTILCSPKIPKGPTILSSPKIPKGPTTLSSPKIPKGPSILSSPKIQKDPNLTEGNRVEGSQPERPKDQVDTMVAQAGQIDPTKTPRVVADCGKDEKVQAKPPKAIKLKRQVPSSLPNPRPAKRIRLANVQAPSEELQPPGEKGQEGREKQSGELLPDNLVDRKEDETRVANKDVFKEPANRQRTSVNNISEVRTETVEIAGGGKLERTSSHVRREPSQHRDLNNSIQEDDEMSLHPDTAMLEEFEDILKKKEETPAKKETYEMSTKVVENFVRHTVTDFNEAYETVDRSDRGVFNRLGQPRNCLDDKPVANNPPPSANSSNNNSCRGSSVNRVNCDRGQTQKLRLADYLRGACFPFLRDRCDRCPFSHDYHSLIETLYEKLGPSGIPEVMEQGMRFGYRMLCVQLYSRLMSRLEEPVLIPLFQKVSPSLPRDEGLLRDTVDRLRYLGLPVKVIADLMVRDSGLTLENRHTVLRIVRDRTKPGQYWETVKDCLQALRYPSPESVHWVIEDCLTSNGQHAEDIRECLIRRLPPLFLAKMDGQVRQLEALVRSREVRDMILGLCPEANQIRSPGSSHLGSEAEVNAQRGPSLDARFIDIVNNNNNVHSCPGYTGKLDRNNNNDKGYTLRVIEDLPEPRSVHGRNIFREFYLQQYHALREALEHGDYRQAVLIMRRAAIGWREDERGFFVRGCYRILCKELKRSERHLTRIAEEAVKRGLDARLRDLLSAVARPVLARLADEGHWILAGRLLCDNNLLFPVRTACQVILDAQIRMANREPREALAVLRRWKIIRTNRSAWRLPSREADEPIRAETIQCLLDELSCRFPDDGLYLFKFLTKDQASNFHPIDLTRCLDRLAGGILARGDQDSLVRLARTVLVHGLSLREVTFRALVASLLGYDRTLARDLYKSGLALGVYRSIELRPVMHVIVNVDWTEEEIYLTFADVMEQLLVNLGHCVERVSHRQLTVYLIFENKPTISRLYKDAITEKRLDKKLIACKRAVRNVIASRFDPPLAMVKKENGRICKLSNKSVLDYLRAGHIDY